MPETQVGRNPDSLGFAFASGDADLRAVYDQHGSLIYAMCRKALGETSASEVTQDVFVSAWQARHQFDPERGALGAWLVGIAKRRIVDHVRREQRHSSRRADGSNEQQIDSLPADDRTEERVDRIAQRMEVAQALATLPERSREMIGLAYVHGLTHHEIAERTGIPLGTIKSDIRRGLLALATDWSTLMSDDRLEGIEALLAELTIEDLEPVTPPTDLWAGIERSISDVPDVTDESHAPVRSIAPRHRSVGTWMLAAAAAVVLVVAGTLVVVGSGTDEPVLSAAELSFDPDAFDPRGADATAQARLVNRDGAYTIELTNAQFPQLENDDLELWLIQPDATGAPVDVAPVALIDPDGDGVYEVPTGLDPATHFVVDISIEPRDGDTAHSGQSILRGALQQS